MKGRMEIASSSTFESLTQGWLHFIVQMICESLPEEMTGNIEVWEAGGGFPEVEAAIKGTVKGEVTTLSLHLSRDRELGETDVTMYLDDEFVDEIGFNDGIAVKNIVGQICQEVANACEG